MTEAEDPGDVGGVKVHLAPDAVILRLALFLAVAGSAAAQTGPVGTWELEGVEASPVEDELVFARLTVSDDRIWGLYVFLDPDDGELSGRRTRARYLVSDGQLVIRENNGVTVWGVVQIATGLRIHDLETGTILRFRRTDPSSAIDPALVGSWSGTRDGRPFALRLDADGTAERTDDGDRDTGEWAATGAYLILDDDPARYTFVRDAQDRLQLVVEADGERTILSRAD